MHGADMRADFGLWQGCTFCCRFCCTATKYASGNSVANCRRIVQTVTVTEHEKAVNGWPPIDSSDGWAQILTDLQRDLQQIDPGHVVRQVKQKFGVLKVWAEASDPALADAFHDRITVAEQQSSITCERCGVPGQLHQRDSGWYSTRCDVHAQPSHRWPACPWPGWALPYARMITDLVRIDPDLVIESVDVRAGEMRIAVLGVEDDQRSWPVYSRIAAAVDETGMTCVVCGAEADAPDDPIPPLCAEHR